MSSRSSGSSLSHVVSTGAIYPFYGHEEIPKLCARFITHLFACPDLPPLSTAVPPAPSPLTDFIAYALYRLSVAHEGGVQYPPKDGVHIRRPRCGGQPSRRPQQGEDRGHICARVSMCVVGAIVPLCVSSPGEQARRYQLRRRGLFLCVRWRRS